MLDFIMYPNCDSCRKAKKWLTNNNLEFKTIHIVEETPSKEEILELMNISELPPRRFFNTSGKVYRELNMKDKIQDLNNEQMAEYLAADGMLIRRPLITDGKKLTIGFNKENLEETWL